MQIEHALTAVGSGQTSLGIKGACHSLPFNLRLGMMRMSFFFVGTVVRLRSWDLGFRSWPRMDCGSVCAGSSQRVGRLGWGFWSPWMLVDSAIGS